MRHTVHQVRRSTFHSTHFTMIRTSFFVSLTCLASVVVAQSTPTESDYYPITTFEIPEGVVLEAGGFQLMPDGKMAVCSRRARSG